MLFTSATKSQIRHTTATAAAISLSLSMGLMRDESEMVKTASCHGS